ncbi:hypothetical protein V8C86DRAFT_351028 [Haematococcus lacustris]
MPAPEHGAANAPQQMPLQQMPLSIVHCGLYAHARCRGRQGRAGGWGLSWCRGQQRGLGHDDAQHWALTRMMHTLPCRASETLATDPSLAPPAPSAPLLLHPTHCLQPAPHPPFPPRMLHACTSHTHARCTCPHLLPSHPACLNLLSTQPAHCHLYHLVSQPKPTPTALCVLPPIYTLPTPLLLNVAAGDSRQRLACGYSSHAASVCRCSQRAWAL